MLLISDWGSAALELKRAENLFVQVPNSNGLFSQIQELRAKLVSTKVQIEDRIAASSEETREAYSQSFKGVSDQYSDLLTRTVIEENASRLAVPVDQIGVQVSAIEQELKKLDLNVDASEFEIQVLFKIDGQIDFKRLVALKYRMVSDNFVSMPLNSSLAHNV